MIYTNESFRDDIYKFISMQDSEYSIKPYNITKKEINDNITGKYIIRDIVTKEINMMKYHYIVTFENGTIKISSHKPIYSSDKLKYIVMIANFLHNYMKSKYKLNAYIYLTNLKKTINEKDNSYFGVPEVNSGYCSFDNKIATKLVVWRKEDSIKVFIHEMIHYFKFDNHFINKFKSINSIVNSIVKPIQITKNNDNSFEAFTDYYAITIYCIMLYMLDKNTHYNIYYNDMILYTENLCKTIYYHTNDINNIINNDSNVFSYYVLKYGLFNTNKFLFKLKDIKKIIIDNHNYFINNKLNYSNSLAMVNKQIYL
jgi:hypothetical protein